MQLDGQELEVDLSAPNRNTRLKISMSDVETKVRLGEDISLSLTPQIHSQSQISTETILDRWKKPKSNAKLGPDDGPLSTRSQRLKEDFFGTLTRAVIIRIKR